MSRNDIVETVVRSIVRSVLVEEPMKTKGASAGMTPWPASVKDVPYKPKQAGVGPGEERLAHILGGSVQGGSVSYDVVDKAGNKWEVKEPDKGREIRPGTEGLVGFATARAKLESVIKRIDAVFGSGKMQMTMAAAKELMTPESLSRIQKFCTEEAPFIVKGEISKGRIEQLYDVMGIIAQAVGGSTEKAGTAKKFVSLRDGEHELTKDVDISTYVKVGKSLDYSADELNVTARDVLASTFKSSAFKDPTRFMADVWDQAAKASQVFGKTSGVILVTPDGYRVVPTAQLDDVLVFNRVTQGKPKFRVAK